MRDMVTKEKSVKPRSRVGTPEAKLATPAMARLEGSCEAADWLCGRCARPVSYCDEALQCEGRCRAWLHASCLGLSSAAYARLAGEEASWRCPGSHPACLNSLGHNFVGLLIIRVS